tara:strand:+ start:309 stop:1016 length:708 start_codon:yes stop_codon:yes gene_type:complete
MSVTKVSSDLIDDAGVTTAKVADNAITLAKMASGTDGNIISYDASGNPVAIATGSDGQVLTSAGAGAPPVFETPSGGGFTLGTEQATTSGTAMTFGGIPAGTTRIIVSLVGVSISNTNPLDLMLRLGDAGGIETASYPSSGWAAINTASAAIDDDTAGFLVNTSGADASSYVFTGTFELTLEDASDFTWICNYMLRTPYQNMFLGSGYKKLSAELTQLQFAGGTFDAGVMNIMYQ